LTKVPALGADQPFLFEAGQRVADGHRRHAVGRDQIFERRQPVADGPELVGDLPADDRRELDVIGRAVVAQHLNLFGGIRQRQSSFQRLAQFVGIPAIAGNGQKSAIGEEKEKNRLGTIA